jgi:hypothetical protein
MDCTVAQTERRGSATEQSITFEIVPRNPSATCWNVDARIAQGDGTTANLEDYAFVIHLDGTISKISEADGGGTRS